MTQEAIAIRRYQPSDADAVIAIWEAAKASGLGIEGYATSSHERGRGAARRWSTR